MASQIYKAQFDHISINYEPP